MSAARTVRYAVRHGDRRADVTVEAIDAGAGLYRVTVDGRERIVEWAPVGVRSEGTARFDDRWQHEFSLVHEGPERRRVELADGAFTVECVEALVAEARESAKGAGSSSGEELAAPIPGRVVKILVAPGDEVTAGQPVVILEAMKMQNELRTTSSGIVEKLFVAEGQAVDGGTTLVKIGAPKPAA